MTDNQEKADILFGDTAPKEPKPTNSKDAASLLYPTMEPGPDHTPLKDRKESHVQERQKGSDTAQDIDDRDRHLANADVKEAVGELVQEFGMEANEVTSEFTNLLGKHNLDATVAKELLSLQQRQMEATQQAYEDQKDQLIDQWRGQTEEQFSSYEISSARSLIREYGDSELTDLMDSGIGNHPALVRFISRIARDRS